MFCVEAKLEAFNAPAAYRGFPDIGDNAILITLMFNFSHKATKGKVTIT